MITLAILLVSLSCAHRSGAGHRAGFDPEVETQRCRSAEVAVQVLGSGGPIPDDARASSSYLVWVDGHARVLVDAGGGLMPRFGQSSAQVSDLEAIAISHMHVDHVGGLPALLKGGYFSRRRRPLTIIGPSGTELYPAMDEFLLGMLDPERGIFRYLSEYLDEDAAFRLVPSVIDTRGSMPTRAIDQSGIQIDAVAVRHAIVPALGFAVRVRGLTIAFAGDQGLVGSEPFLAMIAGADLFVGHHPIPEKGLAALRHLHARPSEVAAMAARSGSQQLVLAHHMQRALAKIEESRAAITQVYAGPVVMAQDMMCIKLR